MHQKPYSIAKTGMLLCKCKDRSIDNFDLQKIKYWLEENHPNTIIGSLEALCYKPKEIRSFIKKNGLKKIIFAACRDYEEFFNEIANKENLKHNDVKNFDIIGQFLPFDMREEGIEKAKILLSSIIQKINVLPEMQEDNTYPTVLPKKGKISRRSFLKSLKVLRYKTVPQIKHDLCSGHDGCDFCIKICPERALLRGGKKVQINYSKCVSCGICVFSCHREAIIFPPFSQVTLDETVRALATANPGFLEPRILLFTCVQMSGIFSEPAFNVRA